MPRPQRPHRPHRPQRPRRRLPVVAVATLVLLLVAAPAWADPAGPTHYRSEVTDIEPGTDGIRAEVHGGDSYLVLEVAEGYGREVLVPGYEDEEVYLRFAPDGRVFENRASATYFQNQDRYGSPVPSSAGPDAEPQWVQVSDDGSFAWHDHRIHHMSPTPPDQVDITVDEVQPVYPWEVPIVVEGEEHVIHGSLTWYPSPSPLLPGVVFLLAAVAGLLLASRSVTATAGVAAVAGALALVTVLGGRVLLPTGVQAEPALLPPAIVALAAPALALLGRRRPAGERLGLAGLGTLTALLVVVLQGGALTRPVVPNLLPGGVVRAALAAVLGLALAVIVAVVRGFLRDLGGGLGGAAGGDHGGDVGGGLADGARERTDPATP